MSDFRKNDNRESQEILTSITMVSNMPPSYDIAIENVTASHQNFLNSTKTYYQKNFYSKNDEISRSEKENQRLNNIISNQHQLLVSKSNKIRNY